MGKPVLTNIEGRVVHDDLNETATLYLLPIMGHIAFR
jgi:hypothetical protein